MAGFEGTWNITEYTVLGSKLIGGNPPRIAIARVGAQYRVTILLLAGGSLVFDASPNDRTLSYTLDPDVDRFGVRLVFDSAADPQNIVHGPLGSVIERWISTNFQPNDMGTITGTRG
jgi:hypothetical protein